MERAQETGHSTAAEAARVALEAGARRLVLTHISSRYSRDAAELLAEARSVFPETVIARDGMTVDVPYADGE
jgi:ribonuclease Z